MNATTEIDPKLVKQLREKTNAGFMDCKRALVESGGDLEKAETILRTKGIATAAKKATRATKEGIVASYIHLQGKVGVLVEVNCETDFVARNENFREFVKDITLHIAAAHPLYVSRADVPGNLIEAEREIYKAQVQGKPAQVADKIVEGKLEKFYSTVCLLEQGFIKNPDVTISDLLNSKIAELGENIVIRRFVRYSSASRCRAKRSSCSGVSVKRRISEDAPPRRAPLQPTCPSAQSVVYSEWNGADRIQTQTRLQKTSEPAGKPAPKRSKARRDSSFKSMLRAGCITTSAWKWKAC